MEEAPIDRTRRLNRERQKRFVLAHKNELLQKQRDNRKLFKTLKARYNLETQASTPASAKAPTPAPTQYLLNVKNKTLKVIADLPYCLKIINNLDDVSAGTKRKYTNDFKTIHHLTQFTNLNKDLLNVQLFIKKIQTGKQKTKPTEVYGINSVKAYIQAIVWGNDHIEGLTIPNDIKNKYRNAHDDFKILSKEKTDKEQEEILNGVMDSNAFLEMCMATFGRDSKEFLISKLYSQCICRDNFGRMLIVSSKQEAIDKSKNYLIVPKTRSNCSIVLNNYKTAKKYMSFETGLTAELSNLIRNYCKNYKLNYGNVLFPEEKMSGFISSMMHKMNLEGSVIYLRQMFISNELKKSNMSETERRQFARDCMHSPIANLRYVRQIV